VYFLDQDEGNKLLVIKEISGGLTHRWKPSNHKQSTDDEAALAAYDHHEVHIADPDAHVIDAPYDTPFSVKNMLTQK
jgi:hypothetical protein